MVCQARQMRRPPPPLPGKPDHWISEVSKDVSRDQRARLKRRSSVVRPQRGKLHKHPMCHHVSSREAGQCGEWVKQRLRGALGPRRLCV